MKNKIHYSPASRRDMDELWDYIFYELKNPAAAAKTIDRIMAAVARLRSFPELGALIPTTPVIAKDYRFLTSGNYLIFYRVQGTNIYIDRVLYGRRDYLRILFEDRLEG